MGNVETVLQWLVFRRALRHTYCSYVAESKDKASQNDCWWWPDMRITWGLIMSELKLKSKLMVWRNTTSSGALRFPRYEFVCFQVDTICTFYPSLPLTINGHTALIFLNLPRMLFQKSTVGRRDTEKSQESPRHSELRFMILVGSHVRDQMLSILSFLTE